MFANIEIERKFLIDQLPSWVKHNPADVIEQGYLAITDELEVRIRRKGQRAFLTVKSAGARSRIEEEIEIEMHRFEVLWALTGTRHLRKTRYRVPLKTLVVEVDVYADALKGLFTAEVEFISEAECDAFNPPAWLGREVTQDPSYKNQALAVRGLPA